MDNQCLLLLEVCGDSEMMSEFIAAFIGCAIGLTMGIILVKAEKQK